MIRRRPTKPIAIGAAAAVLGLVCLLAIAACASDARPSSSHARASSSHARPRIGVGKARVAKRGKPSTMYTGAWIGDQITGTAPPYDMNAVHQFAGMIGKGLSIVEWAQPFSDCSGSSCNDLGFPTSSMQDVRNYGAIPMLSWSSASVGPPNPVQQPDFQLSDVISGRYDNFIRSFAMSAKAWGHPYFLRFDWEMNSNWMPWGVLANGNSPDEFVAAWRHVHDIFTSVGATNATWLWCPYVDAPGTYKNLRQLYPGPDYVDWSCLDVYNWGNAPANPHAWRTFRYLFDETYGRFIDEVAPDKPMMLGEMGTSDFGGDKAAWLRSFFGSLWRYPKVRAVVYFDVNDRGTHWPVEMSQDTLNAFAAGFGQPYFLSNSFSNFDTSPIPPPAG
jgi:hypothetical protein